MSERDINANIDVLKHGLEQLAGADLPTAEREVAKALAIAGLELLRNLLLDINMIAQGSSR